jgi:hypothetical protein
MQKQMTQSGQTRGGAPVNPMMVGAMGAAVGAMAAWFTNAKNRQKATHFLEDVVNKARTSADDARKVASNALDDLQQQASEWQDTAQTTSRQISKKAAGTAKKLEAAPAQAKRGAKKAVATKGAR